MIIVLLCILVATVLFGCFAVLKFEHFNRDLAIHKKLIESLEEQHQDLLDDLHRL